MISINEVIALYETLHATMERRRDKRPLEEQDMYGKAFIQSFTLFNHIDKVKEFVFAQRFARLAAELLGVDGVRL